MELTNDEKSLLLNAARNSIKQEFEKIKLPLINYSAYPQLKLELGAFVTLKIGDELRGCIGYITGQMPLFETVIEVARQSAFLDPRFLPLTKDEFEKIKIEISVLSAFEEIKSYDEIIIGRHGLLLEEEGRAILLPQVATEYNYNCAQFLTALCNKAGLYSYFWKERMLKIKIFTASVFGEE